MSSDSEVSNSNDATPSSPSPTSLASLTRRQLRPPAYASESSGNESPSLMPAIAVQQERRLATILYLLTTALLFADQNLLSPNLSAIAAEFGLDDIERDKKLGGE